MELQPSELAPDISVDAMHDGDQDGDVFWSEGIVRSITGKVVTVYCLDAETTEEIRVAGVGQRIRLLVDAGMEDAAWVAGDLEADRPTPGMPNDVLFGGGWLKATVQVVGDEAVTVLYMEDGDTEDIPIANVAARLRWTEEVQVDDLAPDMSVEVRFGGEWYLATGEIVGPEGVTVLYVDAQENEDIPKLTRAFESNLWRQRAGRTCTSRQITCRLEFCSMESGTRPLSSSSAPRRCRCVTSMHKKMRTSPSPTSGCKSV